MTSMPGRPYLHAVSINPGTMETNQSECDISGCRKINLASL